MMVHCVHDMKRLASCDSNLRFSHTIDLHFDEKNRALQTHLHTTAVACKHTRIFGCVKQNLHRLRVKTKECAKTLFSNLKPRS